MKRSDLPEVFLNYRLVGWGPVIAILSVIIGWPLCVAFVFLRPAEFGWGYFIVISFFLTIALGALFWVLLHHAVDAAWSVTVRRIWEHLACLLMPLFVLSIPVAFFPLPFRFWFSPAITWLLLGISLFVLAGAARLLRKISVQNDLGRPGAEVLGRVAFIGLFCYGIGFSLISILGWLSLQGGWISAIWPVYLFTGSALSGLALSILMFIWLLLPTFNSAVEEGKRKSDVVKEKLSVKQESSVESRPLPPPSGEEEKIKADHFQLFGKLLFAFTLLWAYIAFSQYLIIWYSNLRTETVFFQIRGQGWARVVAWILMVGHFFLPCIFLLPRVAKSRPKYLAALAAWLIFMHFIDLCWLLLAPARGNLLLYGCALVISFVTVGGTLALLYFIWLGKAPLWPVADHRLQECLSLVDE